MDLLCKMLVAVSILLFVTGHAWALFAQHPSATTIMISSTAAAVPPNCNCSLFSPPSGPPPPPPPPHNPSSGRPTPGAHPPPPPGPPPHALICGNDGRNYSNPCEFINAQARNSTLGGRLCPKDDDIFWLEHALSNDHNELEHEMEPDEEEVDEEGEEDEPACFTDGHTAASGIAAATYLKANPRVGIRCGGPCPCTLACPTPHHPPPPEDHHIRSKRSAENGHLNGHLNPEKHGHLNGHLNPEKHTAPAARRKRNPGHLSGEKHLGGGHRDSNNPVNGGGHTLTGHGATGDHP